MEEVVITSAPHQVEEKAAEKDDQPKVEAVEEKQPELQESVQGEKGPEQEEAKIEDEQKPVPAAAEAENGSVKEQPEAENTAVEGKDGDDQAFEEAKEVLEQLELEDNKSSIIPVEESSKVAPEPVGEETEKETQVIQTQVVKEDDAGEAKNPVQEQEQEQGQVKVAAPDAEAPVAVIQTVTA